MATNLARANQIIKSVSRNCRQTSLSEPPAIRSNSQETNIDPHGPELKLSQQSADKNAFESLSALTILLEHLSPKERAVLLLRDVFDCDYDEIASVISKRADTCRQLLRRARQHLADARPRFEVSTDQLQKLARQFALTCASGDLKGLVTVLA